MVKWNSSSLREVCSVVQAAEADIGRSLSVDCSGVIWVARCLIVGTPNAPVVNALDLADLVVGSGTVATTHLALALVSAADVEFLCCIDERGSSALVVLHEVGTPVIAVVLPADLVCIVTSTRFAVLARGLLGGAAKGWGARLGVDLSGAVLTVSEPVAPVVALDTLT